MADLSGKPVFRPGMELTSDALNELAGLGQRVVRGGGAINVQRLGDRTVIDVSDPNAKLPSPQNYLQQFVVLDVGDPDCLKCSPYLGDSDGAKPAPREHDPAFKGSYPAVVWVARPHLLQQRPWAGRAVVLSGTEYDVTYTGVDERSLSTPDSTFSQVIDPPYVVGEIITARKTPTGYYQASGGGELPVMWQDVNEAGRTWQLDGDGDGVADTGTRQPAGTVRILSRTKYGRFYLGEQIAPVYSTDGNGRHWDIIDTVWVDPPDGAELYPGREYIATRQARVAPTLIISLTATAQMSVTLAGFGNGTCSDCAALNLGTLTLPQDPFSSDQWYVTLPGPLCGDPTIIVLVSKIGSAYTISINTINGATTTFVASWSAASWDGIGSKVFSALAGAGKCTVPATLTVTAVAGSIQSVSSIASLRQPERWAWLTQDACCPPVSIRSIDSISHRSFDSISHRRSLSIPSLPPDHSGCSNFKAGALVTGRFRFSISSLTMRTDLVCMNEVSTTCTDHTYVAGDPLPPMVGGDDTFNGDYDLDLAIAEIGGPPLYHLCYWSEAWTGALYGSCVPDFNFYDQFGQLCGTFPVLQTTHSFCWAILGYDKETGNVELGFGGGNVCVTNYVDPFAYYANVDVRYSANVPDWDGRSAVTVSKYTESPQMAITGWPDTIKLNPAS